MASHPAQNHQKMQLKMHQHYRDSNGAYYRDISQYRYYHSALCVSICLSKRLKEELAGLGYR